MVCRYRVDADAIRSDIVNQVNRSLFWCSGWTVWLIFAKTDVYPVQKRLSWWGDTRFRWYPGALDVHQRKNWPSLSPTSSSSKRIFQTSSTGRCRSTRTTVIVSSSSAPSSESVRSPSYQVSPPPFWILFLDKLFWLLLPAILWVSFSHFVP